jgi:hypothetical protein
LPRFSESWFLMLTLSWMKSTGGTDIKVRYRINDTKPPAVPGHLVAWNALDGLDPETAGSPEPKVVSIDGLLRQSVMITATSTRLGT